MKNMKMGVTLLLLAALTLGAFGSIASAQTVPRDSIHVGTLETSIAPPASAPVKAAAGGMIAVIIEVLNKFALVLPILLAFGAGWKYLPVVKNFVNEGLIPLLNALLAFLVGFGGGVGTAHAGVFGDLGKALSIPAQLAASVLLSYLSALIHDKFLKGVTPPSPYSK